MVFKTWFSWIRGNDKIIIGNLEKQGEILVRATSDLVVLISNYDKIDLTQRASTIKELEHEGDKLTHELFTMKCYRLTEQEKEWMKEYVPQYTIGVSYDNKGRYVERIVMPNFFDIHGSYHD